MKATWTQKKDCIDLNNLLNSLARHSDTFSNIDKADTTLKHYFELFSKYLFKLFIHTMSYFISEWQWKRLNVLKLYVEVTSKRVCANKATVWMVLVKLKMSKITGQKSREQDETHNWNEWHRTVRWIEMNRSACGYLNEMSTFMPVTMWTFDLEKWHAWHRCTLTIKLNYIYQLKL